MTNDDGVRARLLQAAIEAFLADDYHRVTTRAIAQRAQANVSMIRYYYGSKQGLYEEAIRDTLGPLLAVLDGPTLESVDGFRDFLRLYYETMTQRPELPALLVRVLALQQGPGRRYIGQMLERGRTQGARRVAALKARGEVEASANPDLIRIAFLSLAMGPMVFRQAFETQMGRAMDAKFLDALAAFNGGLLAAALRPRTPEAAA